MWRLPYSIYWGNSIQGVLHLCEFYYCEITIFQSSFLDLNRIRCTWNAPFSGFNVICQTIKTYNWWRYASLSIILTADNKIRKERKPTKFLDPIHRFFVKRYFGYCKHSLPSYCKIIWKLTSLATICPLSDFIFYPISTGYSQPNKWVLFY